MEFYWNTTVKDKPEFEKVSNNINTDVCIIGAGITGLSLGYYLSKHKNCVILEKDKICLSTSGKNTGKLTSQHGIFYKYLLESNGVDYAQKYLQANEEAIENVKKIIQDENIECEFKTESAYVFTRKREDNDKIKNEEKVVNKLKEHHSKVLKEIELPLKIESAIEFKNQAKFNPVKYCYGLANVIIKNKSKIYENSKATKIINYGDKYEVLVNNYKITANTVVLATRYPTINIPGYYFLKMYQSTSYAMVADVKENLFDGYYISLDSPIISFRTIEEDGRKLLLAVGYDYKTGTDQITNGYEGLEKTIKNMYPKAEILSKWTAEDCISLDKIAYIGEYSNLMKNLYVATGFNKWGLTTSNIAANIITDKIMGRKNKYEEIYRSTRLEPIKNKDEMKNMISEATNSIVLKKLKIPKETLDDIQNGDGKIVNVDNKKIGVYKSEEGKIYTVKPVCTHLGCELHFNKFDKIWECPCHGSKFTYEGKAIEVPRNNRFRIK